MEIPPLFIPVTNDGGIGNTLKGFVSALAISDDVIIVPNLNTRFGNYTSVLDATQVGFYHGRQSFSTCRFLVLQTEEDKQKDLPNEFSCYSAIDLDNRSLWPLFSKKVMIDWYFDKTLIDTTVFNRIYGGVQKIKWNDKLQHIANKIFYNMPQPVLGVSIRSWKGLHPGDRGCSRPYDKNIYIQAMKDIVSTTHIGSIFMSYDNPIFKSDYETFLKDFIVESYVGDNTMDPLEVTIINMMILSKSQYYICNRISTFAEMVYWMGG